MVSSKFSRTQAPEETTSNNETEQVFLQHRTRIPLLVRIYGEIIMTVNGIAMLLAVPAGFLWIREGNSASLTISIFSVLFMILFILYCIGKGLRDGRRSAVYALCLIAMPGISVALAMTMNNSTVDSLFVLGLTCLVYLPPIISAFCHWDAFLPKKENKLGINCPNCGHRLYGVTESMIGQIGMCKKCKAEFTIDKDLEHKRK